ncbi:MAG: hypothetical protein HYR76_02310 [Ignavibacteria bacterium]|nr:hypothetical protein [Ignavibacteria bacterium]MBI3764891.1 hypothetical protein [Ignavibacteriales bacterium]
MKHFIYLILLAVAGVVTAQNQPVAWDKDIPVPTSPFQPDLTPGYVLIEGDIQIPLAQYNAMFEAIKGAKGEIRPMATYGPATLWPNNTVPYDFVDTGNGGVSSANRTAAMNAMNNIAARAGVIFRPALGGDANRIRFQNSSFNNSPVGVQGGVQIINIANWGNSIVICHEVFHSLGFQHEQSRPDRNTYVTINSASVCGTGSSGTCAPATCQMCQNNQGNWVSCMYNFDIVSQSNTYGPYDFDSFMHYGAFSFSCDGNATIMVNSPYTATIGQRNHFSYFDAITCRALYPFGNDRWLDRAYGGSTAGTFQQPYNNTTLAGALANVPSGGTLFIKFMNTYSAVGTYSTPVTIIAPNGAVLGN